MSASGITIALPNAWTPRRYQLPVLQALEGGKRRASTWWHRRAGKDSCAVNFTATQTHQRIGTYWHILPTLKQARKVIWQGIDKEGRRIVDQAFPLAIRQRTRDDEMMIELKCGSIWQLVGGDNYDALVGSNVIGAVFSEWALTDPRSWDYIRPILAENNGWSWFITTPRGKNHAHKMHTLAANDQNWFHETLTVEDTKAISLEAIDAERKAGMPEARIRQEFYCDPESASVGSIYRSEIEELERSGAVGDVPHDPSLPVETWWDIGLRDNTAIWFIQRTRNGAIHVIDFLTDRGKIAPHYFQKLREKPYSYNRHVGPHDLERTNWATGATILNTAALHGIEFKVAPKLSVDEGIDVVRMLLRRCRFDAVKTAYGLQALSEYERGYDEEDNVLAAKPTHNWASHPADAFRTGAVTEEGTGLIPVWARGLIEDGRIGHNGGPPLQGTNGKLWTPYQRHMPPPQHDAQAFDPLATWR